MGGRSRTSLHFCYHWPGERSIVLAFVMNVSRGLGHLVPFLCLSLLYVYIFLFHSKPLV